MIYSKSFSNRTKDRKVFPGKEKEIAQSANNSSLLFCVRILGAFSVSDSGRTRGHATNHLRWVPSGDTPNAAGLSFGKNAPPLGCYLGVETLGPTDE